MVKKHIQNANKLTIVGRGTVGCLSAAHFLKHSDWDIDWVYDPNVPAVSVGEGTTLLTPRSLHQNLGWYWSDMQELGFTPKTGIYKENWGSVGNFTHPFPLGSTGIHFNAVAFQDKAFNQIIKDKRVNLIEKNVSEYEDLDSNYVLVCTGSPKDTDDFVRHEEIPVNAAYVTQCFWPSARFTDTLTIARPYGWVFGIPLQNRCSIGYLYNKDINTLEEVQKDVLEVFSQLKLKPSDKTNHIYFNNYSRKQNYTSKVAYNGNASFFLEPLEATSLVTAEKAYRFAYDIWSGNMSVNHGNKLYTDMIKDVKAMICLHYMAGSVFDTTFWKSAKTKADTYIQGLFDKQDYFAYNLLQCINCENVQDIEMGAWNLWSYKYNTDRLGITEKIKQVKSNAISD